MVTFGDPVNPTSDELRAWAFDAHAPEPIQDFELCVDDPADPARLELLFALAGDPACPKREFFLDVLGLLVSGAAIGHGRCLEALTPLVARAAASADPTLARCGARWREILEVG